MPLRCSATAFGVLQQAQVVDPTSGATASILAGLEGQRVLVVLSPQLGDFDSAEYAEQLAAVGEDLASAGISLRFVGIGAPDAAKQFAAFNGLPLECIRTDKQGSAHAALSCHAGPDWNVPEFVAKLLPADAAIQARARAWLNYMAMCVGLGSRGTIPEIVRGYLGDKSAPERLAPGSLLKVRRIEMIQTCRLTNIHTDIHVHIQTYTHVSTHPHANIHTYVKVGPIETKHTYKHSYLHTNKHAYIHTYKHTYIHTYIHTYKHTNMYLYSYTNETNVYTCMHPSQYLRLYIHA